MPSGQIAAVRDTVCIGTVISVTGVAETDRRTGLCLLAHSVVLRDVVGRGGAPRSSEELPDVSPSATTSTSPTGNCSSTRDDILSELSPRPTPWVAFDLAFHHHMNDVESRSLARQLTMCYAANQKSRRPFNLLLSSFTIPADEQGCGVAVEVQEAPMLDILSKQHWERWHVHRTSQEVWDWFPRDKLVYLTADSPNVLDRVEPGHMYCIGGLVDHKVKAGVALERARSEGVPTARLPLEPFVDIRKPALSSLAVFQMLGLHFEHGDWTTAVTQCPAMHCAPIAKYVRWKVPHGFARRPSELV